MKKYLLTIFGDFGKPEKHTEIAISASNFRIQNDPCNWEKNKDKC